MTTQSKRVPFAIAGIVGCCAIILLVAIVAGGVYFFVAGGQLPTIGQPAIGGEIKDPIVTMLVAASLDEKGRPVDPKLTFDVTQPQMTVIVQVGKVSAGTLTIAWYKSSEGSDAKLFEHQIQVQDNDRAYSIGKNAGGILAAGRYKVVATLAGPSIPVMLASQKEGAGTSTAAATLAGQTEELEFDVTPQKGTAKPAGASVPQGQPPVDGGSGKAPPLAPSNTPSSSGCEVDLYNLDGTGDISLHTPTVNVGRTISNCLGPDSIYVVMTLDGHEYNFLGPGPLHINPCTLSGGKDLPGTKVRFDSNNPTFHYTGPDTKVAGPLVVTLGEDDLPPSVLLDTMPDKGTKVKEGQKIDITVTAYEQRVNGPWQTGVKVIHVRETQAGGGEEFFTWNNPDGLPKPCKQKTWEHKEHTSYPVPKNPPPEIEICASADDWNKSGPETCYRYPTADHWSGTVRSVSGFTNTAGLACSNAQWLSNFDVYVAVDGTVSGTGEAHLRAPAHCNQPFNVKQASTYRFRVEGTFDRKQFKLLFHETYNDGGDAGYIHCTLLTCSGWGDPPPSLLVFSVTGQGSAGGQVDVARSKVGGSINAQHIIDLKCEDCK